MPRRPPGPAALWRQLRQVWMQGVLSALPLRVGLVLTVAAAPSIILAILGLGTAPRLSATVMAGVGIAVFGIELVVTRPLRMLRAAVDDWRMGQPFVLPPHRTLPAELRGLGLTFKRATRTLTRPATGCVPWRQCTGICMHTASCTRSTCAPSSWNCASSCSRPWARP